MPPKIFVSSSVNVLRQLVKVIVDVGDEKEIQEYRADPMPPKIFVSSLTPICRNSILVLNTEARSFTSSLKSIRPSAVK
mgnify:CR=1 FL=1